MKLASSARQRGLKLLCTRALTAIDEDVCVVQEGDEERDERPLDALHEVLEPDAKRVAPPPRREVHADLVAGEVHGPHIARDKLVRLEIAVVRSSRWQRIADVLHCDAWCGVRLHGDGHAGTGEGPDVILWVLVFAVRHDFGARLDFLLLAPDPCMH